MKPLVFGVSKVDNKGSGIATKNFRPKQSYYQSDVAIQLHLVGYQFKIKDEVVKENCLRMITSTAVF
jgi:hypothetical protein